MVPAEIKFEVWGEKRFSEMSARPAREQGDEQVLPLCGADLQSAALKMSSNYSV